MSEGFAGGREIRDTYLPFYFRTGSSFSLPTPGFNSPTGGGGGVTCVLAGLFVPRKTAVSADLCVEGCSSSSLCLCLFVIFFVYIYVSVSY